MSKLGRIYGDDFYEGQMGGSYESAAIYAVHLARLLHPASVVDVGCGRGTWLKAFKEVGASRLTGFDGDWNSSDNLLDDSIEFIAADLNRPVCSPDGSRFDLAMSLEVAEHLEPASAPILVDSLTGLADVVMFGAAYTGQGGKNHINERPHSYWAGHFREHGYVAYDFFRPYLWGDNRVCFWYRQNTFLYIREGCGFQEVMHSRGYSPLSDVAFMDCVHPELYMSYFIKFGQPTFRQGMKMIFRSLRPRRRPSSR